MPDTYEVKKTTETSTHYAILAMHEIAEYLARQSALYEMGATYNGVSANMLKRALADLKRAIQLVDQENE